MIVRTPMRWFLLALLLVSCAFGDDGGGNGDDDDGAANAAGDDDAVEKYYYDNFADAVVDDDAIDYWTTYAIQTKRCIVYNNVDVIVFSMFDNNANQCSDSPIGTYVTPVPKYVEGYMQFYAQIQQDQNVDDYVEPEAASYVYCTRKVVQNQEYWLQLGCSDDTTQGLAVNIYTDNTCTVRSEKNGMDDANIDVSGISLPFKKCTHCFSLIDVDDDAVDDQFYENRMTDPPFCKMAWMYRDTCNRKCQRIGLEKQKNGWTTADKVLLSILAVFGLGMLLAILNRRQRMSNKDALLEQAAMSAAGLQQAHVIGIFVLVIIIISVFALLELKNITWALLLLMDITLFGYLMKLTVDGSVSAGEAVIGPDGTILQPADSDDSSIESEKNETNPNAGTYTLPEIA